MLTEREARMVWDVIAPTSHDVMAVKETQELDSWVVLAVDDKTGYTFEVRDYQEWLRQREAASLLANQDH